MITAYGIPNCNTVKKAVTWLKDQELPYTFHDFKKQGVTAEQLNNWCAVFGWEKVLNKKGTTWRKLSQEEQDGVKDQGSAVAIMLANPSSIKRPVIEQDGKAILIGFQEEEYADILR
ncbi:ArsC family reductase [Pedobacter duraquae]|uniref:Spx/MgsR family transcriptional regulator n=1 Tax=Pedobacter duraquae TaxID=425511 RepID=A0A4R6IIG2_9SPHI|nr:ArsC family reductase [Pedobacter duraquae]TDO21750.1 Spx/MgsR family transcriptional regulator [Pedobacter duraquae]